MVDESCLEIATAERQWFYAFVAAVCVAIAGCGDSGSGAGGSSRDVAAECETICEKLADCLPDTWRALPQRM